MTDHDSTSAKERETESAARVRKILTDELALRSRIIATVLLLVSLSVSGTVAALWMTEPALPTRTHVGFGLIVSIGLCWSGFFAWVLARRRVLYSAYRVVAARLAVAFSLVFLLSCLLLAAMVPEQARTGYSAAATATLMLVAAVLLLRRARQNHQLLQSRKVSLLNRLGRLPH